MRRRLNLKDRMVHMDAEGKLIDQLPDANASKLSAADYEQIAMNRIDALELEGDVSEHVEILSDLKDTAECITDTIDETLENIDEMSPVEIGAVIGNVEAHIENLGESTDELKEGVDSEAMSMDPRAVTRALLGSYRGKAALALSGTKKEDGSVDEEGFFDIFKSAKTKLSETSTKVKSWSEDNSKRIGDLTATLGEKSGEKKDDATGKSVASALGNRLATVRASGTDVAELVKYADSLTTFPESKSNTTPVDANILSFVKGFDKGIKADDFVKAVRVDGKSVSYVVMSKVKDVVGIREYVKNTIPSAALSAANGKFADANISSAYVKELLDTAKAINDKISTVTTSLLKESDSVENMLKVDIAQATWDKGTGFNFGGWDKFLFIAGGASYGAATGLVMATGLAMMPAAAPLLFAAGIGSILVGAAGAKEKYEDKKLNFEELENADKERILRARAELTAKYSLDAIFGLNSLVNELLETAGIILKNLKDKESAE